MKIRQIFAASAAVVLVAGCADSGLGYGGFGGRPLADVEYDGYYDGAYGQVYDGYWRNNAFYYRASQNDKWRKGDAQHFRKDAAPGYNHIHGTAHLKNGDDHGH